MARKRFPDLSVGEVANEMDALEDACTSLVRAYNEAYPDMPDAEVAKAGLGIVVFMDDCGPGEARLAARIPH